MKWLKWFTHSKCVVCKQTKHNDEFTMFFTSEGYARDSICEQCDDERR